MPKRSAEDKIEHYLRKIRKLEQKKPRRIVQRLASSSEEEGAGDIEQDITVTLDSSENSANPISEPETPQDGTTPNEETSELDPELLSALGESISDSPEYGDNIHPNLSKIWLPLLKKGMPKEVKDKLLKDYAIPDNCRLLQAPKLNAEISAAVADMLSKRDKILTESQQQLGLGITAINKGMDVLLKSDDKVQAMKHLSNGCRILCDSHFGATQSRIKLLTPQLDKAYMNTIKDSERDETLFGAGLSEKLKAAKAIEKQGLEIKKSTKPQKSFTPQTGTQPSLNQGNWSAPPRYPSTSRGGRGGAKRPVTATTGWHRPYTSQPARTTTQDKDRRRVAARR